MFSLIWLENGEAAHRHIHFVLQVSPVLGELAVLYAKGVDQYLRHQPAAMDATVDGNEIALGYRHVALAPDIRRQALDNRLECPLSSGNVVLRRT
ncbi:hypothetical protein AYR46_07580 [Sphingobium yanoikuyae]|uniref:Uncharacterized protein n=1 Tax=Sphingobium yanoikuyae TaxID=13690 RepID=A0A3G2UYX6_SPHYA|nr:hypothetical protein EBF16_26155 [Sphingobium yanoikuyae]KZC81127.1 hypothetical protein AYR46_07580 [Sphingobium yanoikuyae]